MDCLSTTKGLGGMPVKKGKHSHDSRLLSSCCVSGKDPSYLAKVKMHVISTSPQVYHGDIKTENILLTGWDWYVPCGNDSSFYIWLHFPSEPCKVEMLSRAA